LRLKPIDNYALSKEIKNAYDTIAYSYDKARSTPWKECVDFLNGLEPSLIIDLGCGSGRLSIPALSRGHKIVGVDFSKQSIKIAKEKARHLGFADKVCFVVADVSLLPFQNDVFDHALFVAVLHHLPDNESRIAAIRETQRVTLNNGRALITVWSRFQFRFLIKTLAGELRKLLGANGNFWVRTTWDSDGLFVYRYFYLFSGSELVRLISRSKFFIEKFEKIRIGSKIYPDNYFVTVVNKKGETVEES